ncbi:MAG: SH3 domain-containing protein [Hominenteromicrobium sp.]
MQTVKKTTRAAAVILLAVLIAACSILVPGMTTTANAASNLTSIGLAEHALKAYREGWLYYYGGYGNFNSDGVRTSDCSGLIYSYFCWVDDNSNIKPDWSYPRTVTQQANASSVSGPISSLPRTHGLLVTLSDLSHVGVYVGNGMVADCSTWGVNMRYQSVNKNGWAKWYKLDCITYPTTGWYKFDGDYFYYENGEYVINTTRTIDGVTYTFGSDGKPDKNPDGASNDGYGSSTSNFNAKTTAGVRLREGPGLSYNTLTVLPEGTAVNVTSTKNAEWYAVTTGSGQKGYVYSQYIKITGQVPEDSDDSDTPDAPAVSGESAKTTTAVHLRSGKGTNYSSLGVISGGTAITVTDKSDSSWYGVTVNGKSGYMFSEYIRFDSSTSGGSDESTGSGTESRAAKTTADVHLRSGKGTNYSSKGVISSGTAITVTDTSDSTWYGVTVNGKSGYMFSAYIQFTESGSSATPTPTPTPTPAPSESKAAKTTEYVHLRSGKGTNYSSLGIIPSGTAITVTDTSDSTWYGVTVNGKSGYMFSAYIKLDSSSNDSTASDNTMTTTAYLNLRQGAGTNTSVLLVIPEGSKVTVVEKTSASWYKVTYNGKTGYVCADYLK